MKITLTFPPLAETLLSPSSNPREDWHRGGATAGTATRDEGAASREDERAASGRGRRKVERGGGEVGVAATKGGGGRSGG